MVIAALWQLSPTGAHGWPADCVAQSLGWCKAKTVPNLSKIVQMVRLNLLHLPGDDFWNILVAPTMLSLVSKSHSPAHHKAESCSGSIATQQCRCQIENFCLDPPPKEREQAYDTPNFARCHKRTGEQAQEMVCIHTAVYISPIHEIIHYRVSNNTSHVQKPPSQRWCPTLQPDGTLKEASEIVWFNSPSDKHPIGFVANQEVNISLS